MAKVNKGIRTSETRFQGNTSGIQSSSRKAEYYKENTHSEGEGLNVKKPEEVGGEDEKSCDVSHELKTVSDTGLFISGHGAEKKEKQKIRKKAEADKVDVDTASKIRKIQKENLEDWLKNDVSNNKAPDVFVTGRNWKSEKYAGKVQKKLDYAASEEKRALAEANKKVEEETKKKVQSLRQDFKKASFRVSDEEAEKLRKKLKADIRRTVKTEKKRKEENYRHITAENDRKVEDIVDSARKRNDKITKKAGKKEQKVGMRVKRKQALKRERINFMIQSILAESKDDSLSTGAGAFLKRTFTIRAGSIVSRGGKWILSLVGGAVTFLLSSLLSILMPILMMILIPVILAAVFLLTAYSFVCYLLGGFANDSTILNSINLFTITEGYYEDFQKEMDSFPNGKSTEENGFKIVVSAGTGKTNMEDMIAVYMANLSDNIDVDSVSGSDDIYTPYLCVDTEKEEKLLKTIFSQMNYYEDKKVTKKVTKTREVTENVTRVVSTVVPYQETVSRTVNRGDTIGSMIIKYHSCFQTHSYLKKYQTSVPCFVSNTSPIPIHTVLKFSDTDGKFIVCEVVGTDNKLLSNEISICSDGLESTKGVFQLQVARGTYTYETTVTKYRTEQKEVEEQVTRTETYEEEITGTERRVYNLSADQWLAVHTLTDSQRKYLEECIGK